ncbi:MAG: hypothetical protein R3E60_04575 [Alphaproteobacteria bacterium]
MTNPIFLRHLWSDFSLHRLLITPIVLAALFILGSLTIGKSPQGLWHFVASTGLGLFVVIVIIMGTWRACRSIPEQKVTRTWENIQLSSLSSWQIACGEVFGATAYYWYGGFICLATVALSLGIDTHTNKNIENITLILFLAAILIHATAMQLSLATSSTIERMRPTSTAACFFMAIIVPYLIKDLIDWNSATLLASYPSSQIPDFHPVAWYDLHLTQASATILSYSLMAIWALIGLNQAIRRELQMSTPVIVWAVFILFCLFYFSGFTYGIISISTYRNSIFIWPLNIILGMFARTLPYSNESLYFNGNFLPLAFAFFLSIGFSYFMALWEPKDITQLRRFGWACQNRDWHNINSLFPRWLMTASITAIVGIVFLIAISFERIANPFTLTIIGLSLFAMRDFGLILYLSLERKGRRTVTVFVYFFILYFLVPGILSATGKQNWLFVFIPGQAPYLSAAIIPPLLQALIIWPALTLRWRQLSHVTLEGLALRS